MKFGGDTCQSEVARVLKAFVSKYVEFTDIDERRCQSGKVGEPRGGRYRRDPIGSDIVAAFDYQPLQLRRTT
nr:hypothetical protein [Nocardia sp. NBC_00565]